MLKIAICDDVDEELKDIVAITKDYLSLKGISAELRELAHPDRLLSFCEKETFHIFLLDMVMPMISGLELGREIRRGNHDAQIIYITTEPGFALDAYAVNPLHYLLKPVDKAALFSALDLAMEKVNSGERILVTVKSRDGLHTISTDMIACCEYRRHSVLYTLTNGDKLETTTIRGSFSEHVVPLLRDGRFIQPHTAYVVNMSLVERFNKEGFILKGGEFVPVSGKQYTVIRKAYMNYRLGEVS